MRSVSPATRNQSVPCVSHVWSTQNSLVNMERSSCRTSTRSTSCEYYKLAFIVNVLILLFVIARAEQSTGEQQEVEGIQNKQQLQVVVPESGARGESIAPRRRNFIDGRHFGRPYDSVDVSRSGIDDVANEEKTIKNFDWLSALSKIAKVQSSDETFWNSRLAGSGSGLKFENKISGSKDREVTDNSRSKEVILEDLKVQESNNMKNLKVEFKPKKFHCHPINDIYIPTAEKKMPAYVCKLGERSFILSSERFLEDYRAHVDVTVDESTFLRLVPNSMTSSSSGVDLIPATLVLKPEEDHYSVRKPGGIP